MKFWSVSCMLQLFKLLLEWEALIVAAEGAVKAKALISAKLLYEQCDYCALGSGRRVSGWVPVCSVGGLMFSIRFPGVGSVRGTCR